MPLAPSPHTNRLAKEKSPYLLQHAHNPVDWYPWGEEAFSKAKKENKPIFLSIGYSTCHWCHVMERESFEDSNIAKILNDNFVSIKVDREERPDIDGVYMAVVISMTGGGGWPMSVFLTPDKEPFYGGTYFPPEPKWGSPGFSGLLLSIDQSWRERKDDIIKSGKAVVETLRGKSQAEQNQTSSFGPEVLDSAYRQFLQSFDVQYGGFGGQPKFPMGHNLSFLLRYWKRTGEPKALEMVEKTLSEMLKGGMYDHLGGGFHRYSTDHKWHVPHFEKMLYDQAILAKAYLEAYQATKKQEHANVAREILDYVLRDMQQAQGGFFSAEDADSVLPEDSTSHEKKEGAFFIWSEKEILKILGTPDAEIFNFYFGVERQGNVEYDPHGEFTGRNILYIAHTLEETAQHFKKSKEEISLTLKNLKEKLYAVRLKRPHPHLDDKVLVDWNGLMISSLAFGARVLDEPRYLKSAENATEFIFKNLMRKDERLFHRYRDGEAAILGNLDDYVFLIYGLVDLYEASFNAEYLGKAKRLTDEMIQLFEDKEGGGFFFTPYDGEKILFRQKEIYDGAVPSGNSIAALNLLRLGSFTFNSEWGKKAQRLFEAFSSEIARHVSGYAQLLIALDFAFGPTKEVVVAGDLSDQKTKRMFAVANQNFIPNKVFIFRPASPKEAQMIISLAPFIKEQVAINGKTTAYVCENHACKLPTGDVRQLENLLGVR